jgi:RimJ/RimL family protein N-acetyltransferase
MILDIETERLILRVASLDALQATIDGNIETVASHLQLNVPPDWLDQHWIAQLRFDQWQQNPAYGPWSVRAIALKDTLEMIGYINCHASPDPTFMEGKAPNGVEIGYMLFEPWRRQGYGREAIAGFMQWAKVHGVDSIVLSISPGNEASLALAQSFGAVQIGSHVDDLDGPEDIYLVTI